MASETAPPLAKSAEQNGAAPLRAESLQDEYRKPEYNYSALAKETGLRPGLAIYRRFAALNAKNLLYLQAEIAELEVQLAEQEEYDQQNPKRREYQWIARELMNAEPGEDRQWQKVLEIRRKLQEYNTLLLQQAQLHRLSAPNAYDLTYLREWLWRKRYGARFLVPPEDAWAAEFSDDLVALSRRDKEGDVFSRWFSSSLVPWVHRNIMHPPTDRSLSSMAHDVADKIRRRWLTWKKGARYAWAKARQAGKEDEERPKGPMRAGTIVAKKTAEGSILYEYPDRRLNRATEVVSITLSALLPTTSIVVLNYIPAKPDIGRLAFILGFSGVFTLCLALFTEARRIEIFAAATALASVQVVFIGTAGAAGG